MAKKKRKQPLPDDAKEALGKQWRDQMTPEQENLPKLVWMRVFAKHKIDLSCPKQATNLQIYTLLSQLMKDTGGEIEVEEVDLESEIDFFVPHVFGE